MKKVTFNQVNKWVRQSKKPLDVEMLENFQQEYFGDFRHVYYRFFYHMVKELGPSIALEIGVDHGHTLAHMAAANLNTLVVGIDRRVDCAKNMPSRRSIRLVYKESLNCDAEETIRNMVKVYGKIGVVFQDSSHHYNDSHREFEIYSKYLDKNAIWCVDDIMDIFHDPLVDPPGKSMVEYFDELPGRKKLYEDLHHGSVIGVSLL